MDYSNTNFAEKYRPRKLSAVIGQELAVQEIKNFLAHWPEERALILHGPAGTGKTSIVLAAARENDLDILELNSSDLRNRAKLEETLKPASEQHSLFKKGKILLMDEVDGVTGTDIGGIPELVRVIDSSKHPIIMTCNDVWQSKLSPVRARSKLVALKPVRQDTIVRVLAFIAEKEKIRRDLSFLRLIAIKSQGDLRAALNDLQSYALGENVFVDIKEKRDVEESIFNILKRLFKEREDFLDLFDSSELSLDEIFLWIEENIPTEYKGEALLRAYFALSNADLFRGRIYKNQSWRFLVYQNIFQSAGISYAKSKPGMPGSFTKYEKPKRVLKIWLNNQKIKNKKTIAKKYARHVHCSTKRIMRDFNLLKPILQNQKIQNQLKLSDEEVAFLSR